MTSTVHIHNIIRNYTREFQASWRAFNIQIDDLLFVTLYSHAMTLVMVSNFVLRQLVRDNNLEMMESGNSKVYT